MERREFIGSVILGLTGLASLSGANIVGEDPTIKVKKDIQNLMRKTNISIQYRSINNNRHIETSYFNEGDIWNVNIPLPKLREMKARLEIYAHPDFYVPGHKSVAVFYSKDFPDFPIDL